MSAPSPPTVVQLADAVLRCDEALEVVEDHLSRIAEREGDIHAFNLVLADEAAPPPLPSMRASPPGRIRARWPACPWR